MNNLSKKEMNGFKKNERLHRARGQEKVKLHEESLGRKYK